MSIKSSLKKLVVMENGNWDMHTHSIDFPNETEAIKIHHCYNKTLESCSLVFKGLICMDTYGKGVMK